MEEEWVFSKRQDITDEIKLYSKIKCIKIDHLVK